MVDVNAAVVIVVGLVVVGLVVVGLVVVVVVVVVVFALSRCRISANSSINLIFVGVPSGFE